jgi:UTP--glucose-1-phosphate uridylyltransferase
VEEVRRDYAAALAREITKVIIPAAGHGTRLAPLTHLMPKEMLPLGGKVVLQHVIEECDAAGLDTLLVVLNRRKTALFPVGEETPCAADPVTGLPRRTVYFANQVEQGGLAHAVLHGEAFAGGDCFAVALGDTLIHGGRPSPAGMPGPHGRALLGRMIAAHLEHGAAATVAAQEIPDETISRYGVLDVDSGDGEVLRVRRIVEKPAPERAPSRLAISARYVFSPEIFRACRECGRNAGGEIELTEAMTWLAGQGRPVLAVRLSPEERRLDIGSPDSYAEAFSLLARSPMI